MNVPEVPLEELIRAWKRARTDRPRRCFFDHPAYADWIEHDLKGWLRELQDDLSSGFSASSASLCLIPKANGLYRPATLLAPRDEVVYNLLVGRAFPQIRKNVAELAGGPDIAYPLEPNDRRLRWVKHRVHNWKDFQEKSAEAARSSLFMLSTDITSYYDNIDLRLLGEDLIRVGVSRETSQGIAALLNRWSHPRRRGIPQGYSASDMLAKLYFAPIDRRLMAEGFTHLRYVDDIRVFTPSRQRADEAVRLLTAAAHERSLSLSSGKTYVSDQEKALGEIDGVSGTIRQVEDRLSTALNILPSPYRSPFDILSERREAGEEPPELLEAVFAERIDRPGAPFDKTLFHYLLNRLAAAGSQVAVSFCSRILKSRPEETSEVLRYFSRCGAEDTCGTFLANLAVAANHLPEYQEMLILRWVAANEGCRSRALPRAREIFYKRLACSPSLRVTALELIAMEGDQSDFDRLQSFYATRDGHLERAEVAYAMRKMPAVARDSFYGQAEGDCDLVNLAIRRARADESCSSASTRSAASVR